MRKNGQGTQDSLFSCEITTDDAHPTNRMALRSESYTFSYMADNHTKSSERVILDFDEETKTMKAHMHFLIPPLDYTNEIEEEEEEDSDVFLPVQLASTEDWRNPIATYYEKDVQKTH